MFATGKRPFYFLSTSEHEILATAIILSLPVKCQAADQLSIFRENHAKIRYITAFPE